MGPEIEIIGVGRNGHAQKSTNHENDGFSGSPKNHESAIEKLRIQNEAEYFYGAFGPLFSLNLRS